MPSSTSSSEPVPGTHESPPPERPLPALRSGLAGIVALALFVLGLGAWEWHWRAFGAGPTYRNSEGLWAIQRRRIDHGEGDALVFLGSSRTLFDVQLHVWERLAGERPIQLALEGTSPLTFLEDLAADPDFRGRLVVGISPNLFATGYAYRGDVLKYYREQTPSQRIGQWLSMHLLEPWLAFYDPDFALFTVLKRQDWPARAGVMDFKEVRRLSVTERDRNTRLWDKLLLDPEYAALAKSIWGQFFDMPPPPGMDMAKLVEEQFARTAAAVATLRARGVDVVLIRPPSDGEFREFEARVFPRERIWDVLVARTGVPGIHFEDYPDMQGLELAEWSHLTPADSERYTEALYRALEQVRAGDRR